MKKSILPVCLTLVLVSLLTFLVAKDYLMKRREATLEKIKTEKTETIDEKDEEEEGDVVSKERLTLTDTVFLIKKDTENKELTLRNIEGGNDKVLSYDSKTQFLSKRNQPRSPEEITVGEIFDVTFTTYNSLISEVRESEKIWANKNINRFIIDEKASTIKVGDDLYEIAENAIVASFDSIGEILDVTNLDSISLYGLDKKIYSIIIENGHGYIRITNDSYFVGGWIEIGQELIKVLTEDMLIPVPEGTYDVKVSNKGYVGRETVEVIRDKEYALDLSKVEIEEVAIGHVQFDIKPDYALLYLDGLLTDFEERVPLEYGIHSIRVESAGHETVTSSIKVGSEYANISIVLDESDEDEETSESTTGSTENSAGSNDTSNSTSDSSNSSSTANSTDTKPSSEAILSDNKKIYVEGPSGAEVYVDGTYIGVAPCSTNKVTGNHTITLSKDGFKTKSYSINVSNDGNDLTLSFSELAAE